MTTGELQSEFALFGRTFLSLVLKDRSRAEDELIKACHFFAKSLAQIPIDKTYDVRFLPVQLLQHIVKYAVNPSEIIPEWKKMPYQTGEFKRSRFEIDFLKEAEFYRSEPILDPWLWIYCSGSEAKTELGNENIEEVISEIDLDQMLTEGPSIFCKFFDDYKLTKFSQKTKPLKDYKEFFVVSTQNRIYSMKDAYRKEQWESILEPTKPYSYPNQDKHGRATMSIVRRAFRHYMQDSLTHAEDRWREKKQLPAIGDGWKSETELYYRVKSHLSNEEVILHGKPKWLGRQHFDIWIPKRKIAIEYQGEQHDRPIDFFGGEVAFVQNQRRDARKKSLCHKHGVKLIEVRPGYDINSVLSTIVSSN